MLIISDIYSVLVPVRLSLVDRSKGKYSEHIKNISIQLFEMSNFYAQPNNSFHGSIERSCFRQLDTIYSPVCSVLFVLIKY